MVFRCNNNADRRKIRTAIWTTKVLHDVHFSTRSEVRIVVLVLDVSLFVL